jgi:hypothetical protein
MFTFLIVIGVVALIGGLVRLSGLSDFIVQLKFHRDSPIRKQLKK